MRIFPTYRFYVIIITCAVLLFIGYYYDFVFSLAKGLTLSLLVLALADIILLFFSNGRIVLERFLPDRFSNADENEVSFSILNNYGLEMDLTILDELPAQFQIRDSEIRLNLKSGKQTYVTYSLRPAQRGEYHFGKTNVLVNSPLKLITRRFRFGVEHVVKVYPSFLNLEKYELSAISQSLKLSGQKRMKRIGQSTEFDHIKDYVIGDDPRHINWKASARGRGLMVNHYVDEKSQPIYSVIDKGRPMRMPFEGMTLLDYSINASLVLSNVAIKRGDRAGLVTFQHKPETFVSAQKRNLQINYLLETLYNQETQFNEPDFASLYWFLMQKIKQRSLLLLYTNFESIYTLERQLPYLKMINRHHLLLLVFFRNTELDKVIDAPSNTTIDIYNKSIAKQIADEKANIQKVLFQNGIISLYTRPQNLNTDVINKYIEIKTKRLL
ncbi:MAG: DUF58 domain-containing protein [Ekhidna sp.]|uniref:DUF58 domain-containing protein n=1 Tax=Ekhidna sp. TaxID=2608089 RepID=UPI0032F021B0